MGVENKENLKEQSGEPTKPKPRMSTVIQFVECDCFGLSASSAVPRCHYP